MRRMKKIISRILVIVLACLFLFSVANAAESASTEVQITIEGQKNSIAEEPDETTKSGGDETPPSGEDETPPSGEDETTPSGEDETTPDNEEPIESNEYVATSQPVQTGDKDSVLLCLLVIGVSVSILVAGIWKKTNTGGKHRTEMLKKGSMAMVLGLGILVSVLSLQQNAVAADSTDNIEVTVPATVSVYFDEEGSVSVSELAIDNQSYIPITVNNVAVTECNGWKLVEKGQTIAADTKQLVFELEEQILKAGDNEVNLKVAQCTKRVLNVGIERGAWSEEQATEAAFELKFEYTLNLEETVAYATYCENDQSLNFYRSTEPIQTGSTYRGKYVNAVYTGFESADYGWGQAPWYSIRTQVEKIEFHDIICPTSMKNWFLEFYYTNYVDARKLDTSKVTTMEYAFRSCGTFADRFEMLGLANWDVSNVTSLYMAFCYAGCNAKDEVIIGDLSKWNVSKVTTMCRAFSDLGSCTTNLTLCGLEGWDTSNVVNMSGMFLRTGRDDPNWSLDVSGWSVNQVIYHNEFDNYVEDKVKEPTWVQ